jgi:hypothetical protein
MMPTGVRRKPWNVEKVETSTALHACRTIPSTRQNNSDHGCATLCTVPVDAVDTVAAARQFTNVNAPSRSRDVPTGGCSGPPAVGTIGHAPHGNCPRSNPR